MDKFVDLFNKIYDLSPIPLRASYAFWIGLIAIYWYARLHEKFNTQQKPRVFKRKNYSSAFPCLGIANVLFYWLAKHKKFAWDQNILAPEFAIPIGLILMVIGLLLVGWARAVINGYWGPHIYTYTRQEDQRIVRQSIYKHLRHPIYVGQVLMAAGTLFLSNSPTFYVFAILLLIINIVRAIREEHDLMERFGNEFIDYKDKSYFAIPGFF